MAASSSDPIPGRTGLVDPATADVAQAPERKRRDRDDPHADQVAWKPGAEKRLKSRPMHPMVMLEPKGMDREEWTSLHNDERLHDLQLAEAFGTRSYAVIWTFLRQLEGLCDEKWWDEDCQQWRIDEPTFNTILALVGSVKPRNEMEAAFAAQMAATHMLTMKVSARAIKYEWDTKTVAVASKLARTFAMQMEALHLMRGKSRTARQSIKVRKEVHQHVHYHAAGGAGETGGQSHASDGGATGDRPALHGPDENGRVVPLPSRARKAAL